MCFWLPRTGTAVLIFLLKNVVGLLPEAVHETFPSGLLCERDSHIVNLCISLVLFWLQAMDFIRNPQVFCVLLHSSFLWLEMGSLELAWTDPASPLPNLNSLFSWVTCGCNPCIIQLLAAWGSPSFSECHWWASHRWIEGDFLSVICVSTLLCWLWSLLAPFLLNNFFLTFIVS